jgi:hypothetical protein
MGNVQSCVRDPRDARSVRFTSNNPNITSSSVDIDNVNNLTCNGLVFGHPGQPRVDPLQNKLWVDDDGNLRFGNKKVILQN